MGIGVLMGVPVMVLLLVTAPVLLPEYRDTSAAGRVDLTSVALSLAAILPFAQPPSWPRSTPSSPT